MLPLPRNSLAFALSAGLVSAAPGLVLAWVAYGAGAPRFDFVAPLGRVLAWVAYGAGGLIFDFVALFTLLSLFAAPVLALLALVYLRMYRMQTEPSRERTLATLAVGAAVAPALAAVTWVGIGLVVALLG